MARPVKLQEQPSMTPEGKVKVYKFTAHIAVALHGRVKQSVDAMIDNVEMFCGDHGVHVLETTKKGLVEQCIPYAAISSMILQKPESAEKN